MLPFFCIDRHEEFHCQDTNVSCLLGAGSDEAAFHAECKSAHGRLRCILDALPPQTAKHHGQACGADGVM